MKIIEIKFGLLIALAILIQPLYAADYYFSSTNGQDTRSSIEAQNPNTPWRSIKKLNEVLIVLKPGDNVYLRRGDTFYGTINLNASGTATSPIKIGAYGTGTSPIVTSLQPVQQWRTTGQGRFESSNTFAVNNPSVVTLNGIIQEKGRYPNRNTKNAGYLIIDKVPSSNSISTADPLSGIVYNGGELVVRKLAWITDRHHITSQSGSTFVMGNLTNTNSMGNYKASAGWGFFIQNHIETLDNFGEWYFDNQNKRLYMHFGTNDINNNNVQIATLDYLLTKTFRTNHIWIENIHFNGANRDAINIVGGNNITLSAIEVSNVGEIGIHSLGVKGIEIKNSKISNALTNGISMRNGNENAKIVNTQVEQIGIFQGGMTSGDLSGIGVLAYDSGIEILNNKIQNTAYNGIHFRYNNVLIRNNYINGYCMHKTDGGGIYSYGGASGTEIFQNRIISHNVILNGKGSHIGSPRHNDNPLATSKPLAHGIFLDDNTTNVDIFNNTISKATNGGISLSNNDKINIENNIIFNNGNQINIGNNTLGRDTRNILVKNNILATENESQLIYNFNSNKDDISLFGNFQNNKIWNPLSDDQKISLTYVRSSNRINEHMDLKRWQSKFNNDQLSRQSVNKLPAFEYIKALGETLYDHGKFEGNLVGIGCSNCQTSKVSGKIEGSSLQVISPTVSTLRISVGKVIKDKTYILKIKSKADKSGPLRIFLRQGGSPWQSISNSTTVELSTEIQEHTIMFRPTLSSENSVIMFIADIGNWTYWLDDVTINEAEIKVTDPNDVLVFEYNNTNTNKSINLTQKYIDINGNSISGTIDIGTFSSVLLAKSAEQVKENQEINPTITLINLSNNNESIEGEEINLLTEAQSAYNTISKIELIIENNIYSTSTSSPNNFTINNLKEGIHKVWARASCDKGLQTNSDTLLLNVKKPISLSTNETISESGLKSFFNIGSNLDVTSNSQVYLGESKSGITFSQSRIFTNVTASNDPLFQTERHGTNISISVPVPNGEYTIITYHHELWFGLAGPSAQLKRRVFDISIENTKVMSNFDIFEYNSNRPTALTFNAIVVEDNLLNINLAASVNNATISGIAIIANSKKPDFELYLNSGDFADVEKDGKLFVGDSDKTYLYSTSGTYKQVIASVNPIFHTERQAKNLNYSIKIPNGIYKVITYHNELWFGKNGPSAQAGRRVFDIIIEGKKVKENFDLFVASNNQPTKLEFEDIEVLDGIININLAASVNNGTISGISIVGSTSEIQIQSAKIAPFNLLLNTGDDNDAILNNRTFLGEMNTDIKISGTSGKFRFDQAGVNVLFHTERNGRDISYNIPVPNGSYTVMTLHNELWFGKNGPSAKQNQRVFDILLEGNIVKNKLDLFLENKNQPTILEFRNITVTDGILNLNLKASINNATISGIAIFSESDNDFYAGTNLRRGYREMGIRETEKEDIQHMIEQPKLLLYPNPAKEITNLSVQLENEPKVVYIHNMAGQLIKAIDHTNLLASPGLITIPTNDVKDGLYLLSLVDAKGNIFKVRLIVQH